MLEGAAAVDGYFAVKRNRFGCPPTLARRELIICPFLPSSVGLNPWGSISSDTDTDSDSFTSNINPTIKNENGNNNGNGVINKDELQLQLQPPSTLSYDLLTPALLSPSEWPFSMSELFELALGPPNLKYTPL